MWTKKYQKSPQSDEYKSYTLFELVVEFFEDYFGENPNEMYTFAPGILPNTHDPLVNRWEEQVAIGDTPDLWEGLTPEQAEKIAQWSRKQSQKRSGTLGGENVNDKPLVFEEEY